MLHFLLVLLLVQELVNSLYHGRVKDLPGYNNSNISYSGYIPIQRIPNCALFFWFFESWNTTLNKTDIPIILWFQGGPGASDSLANFFEFGPYRVKYNTDDNTTCLESREVTWVSQFHVLFIDQPIGTGLSYVGKTSDYIVNLNEGAQDIYHVLNVFFRDVLPEYNNNPFYIVGESFGGHWVPYYSDYILNQQNINSDNNYVPKLLGSACGNGWNDACTQVGFAIQMGQSLGSLTQKQADELYAVNAYVMCP